MNNFLNAEAYDEQAYTQIEITDKYSLKITP